MASGRVLTQKRLQLSRPTNGPTRVPYVSNGTGSQVLFGDFSTVDDSIFFCRIGEVCSGVERTMRVVLIQGKTIPMVYFPGLTGVVVRR